LISAKRHHEKRVDCYPQANFQKDHSIKVQRQFDLYLVAILMAYRVSSPVPLLNITTATVDNLDQVAAYQKKNIQCQNTRNNAKLNPPIMIQDKLIVRYLLERDTAISDLPQAFWTSSSVVAMWSNPLPGSTLPFT
jgi:hypothetical protein